MGKPPRNAAAGPGKGGGRANIKNERITRSSRSRLTNGLDDPAQVERKLNQQLKMMGLYAANTTGDGNCLFRALSDQLYGYSAHHARLRQETCDHLASQPDKFSGFVDDKPFDEYIRLMRESGTYGGHLELHAFAQMKQKQIKIVQPGLVYVVSGEDESPEAERAREAKESERLKMQNSVAPGAEGPPPSDREQRRMKREEGRQRKKQSAQRLASVAEIEVVASGSSSCSERVSLSESQQQPSETATPQPASSDVVIEAYGPLYIAYHNWEHYSSVRNLDGPHSGLPRIKEKPIAGPNADGKGKGRASDLMAAGGEWVGDSDGEPTEEEKMVMQSTSGNHSLHEVRRLLKEYANDWAQVVEVLVERDMTMEEETVGAELQVIPLSGEANGLHHLAPPTSLPDHMRPWRAASPASVDTSATHSSGEGGSPSTHTTTEEGPEGACPSPAITSSSRGGTPGPERLCVKRAASVDLSSTRSFRSPKRRSQSRSPDISAAPSPAIYALSPPPTEASVSSPIITPDEPEEREEYEIIKRGRGRPRKDGLPNKSSIAIKRKVPTQREKRDAAIVRKREEQLEKVKARDSPAETSIKAPAEVRGFRELKI